LTVVAPTILTGGDGERIGPDGREANREKPKEESGALHNFLSQRKLLQK
jgi:hypothetical protein